MSTIFRVWETGSGLRNVAGNLLDVIFPPMTLDAGVRALTFGLSAEAWSRITFIDDPACMGCGQPVLLHTNENDMLSVALKSCLPAVECGRDLWQSLLRYRRTQPSRRRHVRDF